MAKKKATTVVDFKTTLVSWLLEHLSFLMVLFCVFLGVAFAILEYPFMAPLEDRTIIMLVGINFIANLLTCISVRMLYVRYFKKVV